mmetsp:Transcript_43102/g.138575  ORF Transcript_43102/g.138575 Transcript_43102/m.138575 type:complete len:223 (-) Transcript_43102:2511-3179(-)
MATSKCATGMSWSAGAQCRLPSRVVRHVARGRAGERPQWRHPGAMVDRRAAEAVWRAPIAKGRSVGRRWPFVRAHSHFANLGHDEGRCRRISRVSSHFGKRRQGSFGGHANQLKLVCSNVFGRGPSSRLIRANSDTARGERPRRRRRRCRSDGQWGGSLIRYGWTHRIRLDACMFSGIQNSNTNIGSSSWCCGEQSRKTILRLLLGKPRCMDQTTRSLRWSC